MDWNYESSGDCLLFLGYVYIWGRDEGEGRFGYIFGFEYEDGICVFL